MATFLEPLQVLEKTGLPYPPQSDDTKMIDGLVQFALCAENAERFGDMCHYLTCIVNLKNGDLDAEQRNLLSVAFKNVVGGLRSSWRNIISTPDVPGVVNDSYKDIIESELLEKCRSVITLLVDKIMPFQKSKLMELKDDISEKEKSKKSENTIAEQYVFFQKMKGDYHRYIAEVSKKKEDKADAKTAYEDATEKAEEYLSETHPTRLGLALNFSVCHFEILKEPKKACNVAQNAFNKAIQKLDTLNDNNYKDSTLIMQLLRDNLTLWQSDVEDQDKKVVD